MNKIFLIRHGQTDWNLEGRTQGIQDSNLTEKGIEDTKLLAKRLREEEIHVIYSSTLNRAKKTAKIISNELNIPVKYNEDLVELNYGEWEGLTIEEIRNKYPEQLDNWFTRPHLTIFPDGEDLIKAQERVVTAFNNILNENKEKEKNILIVSHSTMIRLLLLNILDMNLSSYNRLKQNNCAINVIGIRRNEPVLLQYNDTCYMHKGE